MTKSDPIDRALERMLSHPEMEFYAHQAKMAEPILTDLAAEIERPLLQRIARMEREGFGDRARLAAVESLAERVRGMTPGEVSQNYPAPRKLMEEFIALARGEGGEQAGYGQASAQSPDAGDVSATPDAHDDECGHPLVMCTCKLPDAADDSQYGDGYGGD